MLKIFLFVVLIYSGVYAKSFRVSYDPDYAPFSYAIDGKAYGLFIDIWKAFGQKNGHAIEFVQAKNWDDALSFAKSGKVDFFLGTTPHEPWMYASDVYYKTKTALFTLNSFEKEVISIGIVGDDYKEDLLAKDPHLSIKSYDSYDTLLKALLNKDVDAIYDDEVAISFYAIKNKYIHSIKQLEKFVEISNICAISANSANISYFNEGFKKLTTQELMDIEKHWIYFENERYYITQNEIKYVFDPDWKPFEYKDEMTRAHQGIIADILSLVSIQTGITFKAVPTETWAESVELVKNKEADMFSAVPYTPQRAKYLHFTKNSIYSYPAVLVTNIENKLMLNDTFEGQVIGIVKNNSLGAWIQHKYPKALFREFKNVKEGFEAIENKEVDFFAINGVSALYYINVVGFTHSKVYLVTDYMFHLKIALRKELPDEIINTIDAALAHLSKKDLSDIYHKWTFVQVKKELNWQLLFVIFLGVVFLVVIFIYINKKLKKLVEQKTQQLRELNENLEQKVQQRTQELATINKNIQDSIEYASLLQNTILPKEKDISSCLSEFFIIWEPKDIVGGDIYFLNKINQDECLVFLIDCTGHGVSGAFVTMLAKAIEEQLFLELQDDVRSPSKVLQYFNKSIKKLLNQEAGDINVGLDAGVVYINKKQKTLSFSGANNALFYVKNGELEVVKGDRHSIGYKQSKENFHFTQTTLTMEEDMTFYLTSDGYYDQNGGPKGFPFGKRRFQSLIMKHYKKPLDMQKRYFLEALKKYQQDHERNDDITLIGFRVN